MITVISAPLSPNSIHRAPRFNPPPPVESPTQPDPIMEYLRAHGARDVNRWDIVNAIEPDLGGPRVELRQRRSALLKRMDALVRAGAVEKIGRYRMRLPQAPVPTSAIGGRMPCHVRIGRLYAS